MVTTFAGFGEIEVKSSIHVMWLVDNGGVG
jgi:hypothetical protein